MKQHNYFNFLRITLALCYFAFLSKLIFEFLHSPIDTILSKDGLIICLTIALLISPAIYTLRASKTMWSDLGTLLIFGFISFIFMSLISISLNLEILNEYFYNYKGVVTRKSNETYTEYTSTPAPYGDDISEREVYNTPPQFRGIYPISENIDKINSEYERSNAFVSTKNYIFWQVAALSQFHVPEEKQTQKNKIYFPVVASLLFAIENFLTCIPVFILIIITASLIFTTKKFLNRKSKI